MTARLVPEPHAPPWQRITVSAAYVAAIVSLAFGILFTIQFVNSKSENEDQVRADALQKAGSAVRAIDEVLHSIEGDVNGLIERTRSGEIPKYSGLTGLGSQIGFSMEGNRYLRRLGVFYAPVDDTGLFAPYTARPLTQSLAGLERTDDSINYLGAPSASKTGYADPNRYQVPVKDGAAWTSPFRDESNGLVVTEFGAKFGKYPASEAEQSGVIYADFSFDLLQNLVQWLSFRETGYGFILSRDGEYVTHQTSDYADARLGIDSLPSPQREIMGQALEVAVVGGQAVFDYPDEVTGRDSLLVIDATMTGLPVGYVVFRDEVLSRSVDSKQALMRMAPAFISLIFFLSLIWSRAYAGSWAGLWITAGTLALAFVAGIGLIWYWHSTTPPKLESARVNLGEAISTHKANFAREIDAGARFIDSRVIEAGAGIALSSVEFISTEAIGVEGVVWQTFHDRARIVQESQGEFEDPIISGIFLPDAIQGTGGASLRGSRAFSQRRQGADEQFGWNFNSIFPTSFDFTRYPFDREQLAIRINHADLGRGVLHIPDLNNYDTLLPSELPGVERGLTIDGWDLGRSYFSYAVRDYGSEFGQVTASSLDHATELVYNVEIERSFIGPFISNMLPLVIILLLLFIALLITTKMPHFVLAIAGRTMALGSGEITQDGTIKYGGSPTYGLIATATVMSYTVGLFFAVVLAHARLREQFADVGVLYLEWYYFAAYLAILGVTINAIAYAAHLGGGFIHFRENLIPRVAYWPITGAFLFVVTWMSFYGE